MNYYDLYYLLHPVGQIKAGQLWSEHLSVGSVMLSPAVSHSDELYRFPLTGVVEQYDVVHVFTEGLLGCSYNTLQSSHLTQICHHALDHQASSACLRLGQLHLQSPQIVSGAGRQDERRARLHQPRHLPGYSPAKASGGPGDDTERPAQDCARQLSGGHGVCETEYSCSTGGCHTVHSPHPPPPPPSLSSSSSHINKRCESICCLVAIYRIHTQLHAVGMKWFGIQKSMYGR